MVIFLELYITYTSCLTKSQLTLRTPFTFFSELSMFSLQNLHSAEVLMVTFTLRGLSAKAGFAIKSEKMKTRIGKNLYFMAFKTKNPSQGTNLFVPKAAGIPSKFRIFADPILTGHSPNEEHS